MGNCQSDPNVVPSKGVPPRNRFPNTQELHPEDSNNNRFFNTFKNTDEFKNYLDRFQEANYRRLQETFKNDKELFILNQVLLCVQFFQNFEKSLQEAKDFKLKKESQLNGKLKDIPHEGVIGGDRRVTLMHGMGEVLAQNFIYKPQARPKEEDLYDTLDQSTRKIVNPMRTNACEGILPLDFFLNYDNLELYTEREWGKLKEDEYSSAAATFRFCMEEPSTENGVPKGFVRLLGEKSTHRKGPLTTKGSTYSCDYSNTSEIYGDRVSEAKSSYASSLVSDVSDDGADGDSVLNMNEGEKFLHRLNKRLSAGSNFRPPMPPLNRQPPGSRDSGTKALPTHSNSKFGANSSPFSGVNDSERPPKILIDEPEGDNHRPNVSKEPKTATNGLLRPTWTPEKRPLSRSAPIQDRQDEDSPPLSNSIRAPLDNLSVKSGISATSVPFSADIRRRPLELKELWQYQKKQRLISTSQALPEISQDCLIQVKIDKDDEEDYEEESEDDSDGSSPFNTRKTSVSSDPDDFIIKSYLNSTQFSAMACSDFNLFATKLGIHSITLQEAKVLGTTIRCAMDYKFPKDETNNFQILYTFTPTLQSKQWPQKSLLWFKQRLLRAKYFPQEKDRPMAKPENMLWPSRVQVENIEGFGCSVIPQGFHSPEFFNAQQSMEWQVNFPQAENLLLNTFKNVHWRAYVMTAILFRAFIFPMAPRSVGLAHVRNIIYQMCEQDYVFWNDEESGLHVKIILDRLTHCLGRRSLPNFFIQKFDMLKTAAPENTRTVQAHLSSIRENLIVYSIYALRNLTCLHAKDNFFPAADLKKLYRLITAEPQELLMIANPYLRPPAASQSPNKKKSSVADTGGKKELDAKFQNILKFQEEEDPQRDKLHRKYKRYLEKQKKAQDEAKRMEAEKTLANSIPKTERRKSIDLDKAPVTKFINRRTVMIIEFFIQHFLKMAERAITFRAYAEATMYTLHVQNLCRLMRGMRLDSTHMEHVTIDAYMRETEQLRSKLGPKMVEYVKSKLSHLELPDGGSGMLLSQTAKSNNTPRHSNSSNFTFSSRKVQNPAAPITNSFKTMDTAGVGSTLQYIPGYDPSFSPANFYPEVHDEFRLSQLENLSSRPKRQNLRYIQPGHRFEGSFLQDSHSHHPHNNTNRNGFNDASRRNFNFM